MRKLAIMAVALIAGLTLTSCSGNTSSNDFDNVVINSTPHWDLDKIKLNSWGANNAPAPTLTAEPQEVKTEPTPVSTQPIQNKETIIAPTTDVSSYNYIKITNQTNKCTAEGRILYLESYKQTRGDLYNSKSYIYSLVPPSENPVAGETVTKINNNSYILGYYTMPKALGDNIYHRTAVRTFSTPVVLLGSSGFSKDELGNYNSDLSVGLPTVVIDMSCAKAEDLNDSAWNSIIPNFNLLFSALSLTEPTETPSK